MMNCNTRDDYDDDTRWIEQHAITLLAVIVAVAGAVFIQCGVWRLFEPILSALK